MIGFVATGGTVDPSTCVSTILFALPAANETSSASVASIIVAFVLLVLVFGAVTASTAFFLVTVFLTGFTASSIASSITIFLGLPLFFGAASSDMLYAAQSL